MVIEQAKRIVQALSVWEASCFITQITMEAMGLRPSGPFAHWREFRSYLKAVDPVRTRGFDHGRFWVQFHPLTHEYRPVLDVPRDLVVWAATFKTVYYLTGDWSRVVWEYMDASDSWADVAWPIDAPLVALEQPIFAKGKHFDCILPTNTVDTATSERAVSLSLYSSDLDGHRPFPADMCLEIRKLARRGKFERLGTLIEGYIESPGDIYFSHIGFYPQAAPALVGESIADIHHRTISAALGDAARYKAERFPEWDAAARVILGVIAHMRSLSAMERNGLPQDWLEKSSIPLFPNEILDGARVVALHSPLG